MTREEIEELKGLAASMGLYDDKNPCKRAVILGKAIKALEQEPKTGHWITCNVLQEVKCSECRVCFRHTTNYCPNCGTRMTTTQKRSDEG